MVVCITILFGLCGLEKRIAQNDNLQGKYDADEKQLVSKCENEIVEKRGDEYWNYHTVRIARNKFVVYKYFN